MKTIVSSGDAILYGNAPSNPGRRGAEGNKKKTRARAQKELLFNRSSARARPNEPEKKERFTIIILMSCTVYYRDDIQSTRCVRLWRTKYIMTWPSVGRRRFGYNARLRVPYALYHRAMYSRERRDGEEERKNTKTVKHRARESSFLAQTRFLVWNFSFFWFISIFEQFPKKPRAELITTK